MATRRKWRSWIQWTKLDFYQMSPHHTPQTVSKVTQTTPRHLPDTSQTPSRHPTDTPKYGTFWPIWGNWEKRNKLMKMNQIGCLLIACTSYPPRQYPGSHRQPQMPPRHFPDTPKYGTFWPILGNWEKRNKLMKMCQIGCLSIACTSYPPDSIQSHSDNSRRLPDTLQTPCRHPERRYILTNPR